MNEYQIDQLIKEIIATFTRPNLGDNQGTWIATPRQVLSWLEQRLGREAQQEPEAQEGWEKDVDEKVIEYVANGGFASGDCHECWGTPDASGIKAFIRPLLQAREKEVLEWVLKNVDLSDSSVEQISSRLASLTTKET